LVVDQAAHNVVGVEQGLFNQMADVGVLRHVEHVVAFPANSDQSSHPQLGQLLRHRRDVGADMIGQGGDGVLAV
jgi:hypothetical protein